MVGCGDTIYICPGGHPSQLHHCPSGINFSFFFVDLLFFQFLHFEACAIFAIVRTNDILLDLLHPLLIRLCSHSKISFKQCEWFSGVERKGLNNWIGKILSVSRLLMNNLKIHTNAFKEVVTGAHA